MATAFLLVVAVVLLGLLLLCASPARRLYMPNYRQHGDWRIEWSESMHQPLAYFPSRDGLLAIWEGAGVRVCNGKICVSLEEPGFIRVFYGRKVVASRSL